MRYTVTEAIALLRDALSTGDKEHIRQALSDAHWALTSYTPHNATPEQRELDSLAGQALDVIRPRCTTEHHLDDCGH